MAHPPRIPVLLDDATPVIYFLTLCVDNRLPVLANEPAWTAIRKSAERLNQWHTLALLAMPDHLHALVAPLDRYASPGVYSNWIKRWIRAELSARWKWQAGCFDRLLRSDDSAQQKWIYIRENPVAENLVGDWRDWTYQMGFREPSATTL